MCLITLQQNPKRTLRPITVYKVLRIDEEHPEKGSLISDTNRFKWKRGKLEETELGIHRNMGRGTVCFANGEAYKRYQAEESVTEIAEGFHAYLNKLDAIDFYKDVYVGSYGEAVIVKMRIPAFSLTFRDECRMIVSNKMKLIKVLPIIGTPYPEMPY